MSVEQPETREWKPVDLELRWRVELGESARAPKGRLLFGDNLSMLRRLIDEPGVSGKVRLVYIDPPFAKGRAFFTRDGGVAYQDDLVGEEFLEFLRQRLILLRELLADDGSIYVHIDATIGHYVKVLMDEVFGASCFRNDITRIKCNPKNFERRAYGNAKDTILFYSRQPPGPAGDPMLWNDHRLPLEEEELARQFPRMDAAGNRYTTTPLHAPGETRNGPTGKEWKGLHPPKGRHWRYHPDELTRLDEAGLIEWSSTGNPRKVIYADHNQGKKVQDVWEFKDPGAERSAYPTEKNLDLLKFILRNSTNPGDLVLDAFAGSGTTLLAANELGRSWIGMDASPLGMSVSQARLVGSAEGSHAVSFDVLTSQEASERLTEPATIRLREIEATSLFPEDREVEVILDDASAEKRGDIAAVLVDPDFRGDEIGIREAFAPGHGEYPDRFRIKVSKLGTRMFVLALHRSGIETAGVVACDHALR